MRVIAIDGPAGAGKSTIGRLIAERLGLEYLDTGAMYRAVAFAAAHEGIDLDDEHGVAAFAERMSLDVGPSTVLVQGLDATAAIRTPEVTANTAKVARHPRVRAEMVERQRAWAMVRGGGVLEGRDIGTVVFPDAELKVYLTASPLDRAQRRAAQSGGNVDEIAAAIEARDRSDRERDASPLIEANDAVIVDTSGMTIDAVAEYVIRCLGEPRQEQPQTQGQPTP